MLLKSPSNMEPLLLCPFRRHLFPLCVIIPSFYICCFCFIHFSRSTRSLSRSDKLFAQTAISQHLEHGSLAPKKRVYVSGEGKLAFIKMRLILILISAWPSEQIYNNKKTWMKSSESFSLDKGAVNSANAIGSLSICNCTYKSLLCENR